MRDTSREPCRTFGSQRSIKVMSLRLLSRVLANIPCSACPYPYGIIAGVCLSGHFYRQRNVSDRRASATLFLLAVSRQLSSGSNQCQRHGGRKLYRVYMTKCSRGDVDQNLACNNEVYYQLEQYKRFSPCCAWRTQAREKAGEYVNLPTGTPQTSFPAQRLFLDCKIKSLV